MIVDDAPALHDALKASGLAAYLLGKSWAGSAIGLVGLPIAAAEHVDQSGQIRAVVTAGDKPGVAIAIPLQNPGALIAVTTAGDAAPFRRKPEGSWDLLVPAREEPAGLARAVVTNHLVVASSPEVLATCGAFLGQAALPGVPAGPPREPGAPPRARGVVHVAAARPFVTSAASKLGAAFPLDPATYTRAISWPEQMPFRIEAGAASIRAVLEIGALADSNAPPLEPGPLAKLVELPAPTHAAVVLYQPAAARTASAAAGSSWLSSGPLAGAGESLGKALEDVARARGPGLVLGYERSTTGPQLFGAADLAQPDRARTALEALVEALDQKAVRAALEGRGLGLKAESTVLERVGDVARVRVSRGDETVSSIFVRVEGDRIVFASGASGADALRATLSREPGQSLGAVAAVETLRREVGDTVLAAVLVDAAGLRGEPTGSEAERAFAVGALVPAGERVELRLAADPRVLRALVR